MSECPFNLPIRSHKSDDGFRRIRDNNGHAICKDIVEKAQADYIILAVNCHDDLLKACKWMYTFFADELISDDDCKKFAKAAIAKAKPKPPASA